MKKLFLLVLTVSAFFGELAYADTLIASSSGGGTCQNQSWDTLYSQSAIPPNQPDVKVYGLRCSNIPTSPLVVRVIINGTCSQVVDGNTSDAYTFSGGCSGWTLSGSLTCPAAGQVIYASVPIADLNTAMNSTVTQCKAISTACNASTTPIAYGYNGGTYGPTHFKTYCQ